MDSTANTETCSCPDFEQGVVYYLRWCAVHGYDKVLEHNREQDWGDPNTRLEHRDDLPASSPKLMQLPLIE